MEDINIKFFKIHMGASTYTVDDGKTLWDLTNSTRKERNKFIRTFSDALVHLGLVRDTSHKKHKYRYARSRQTKPRKT